MIGTYPSILMHQQFTAQGCVGRKKKTVFSKEKSENFEKRLQNAGGKVLGRVVPPFGGRQSIFSQSQNFETLCLQSPACIGTDKEWPIMDFCRASIAKLLCLFTKKIKRSYIFMYGPYSCRNLKQ